jgi:hypothetical protein
MTFSNPHDLDAIDSAPVYFFIFIDRVLDVICGELQAETIGKRQLIIAGRAALSGVARDKILHGAGSFQIGQPVSQTLRDILGKLSRRAFLNFAYFSKRLGGKRQYQCSLPSLIPSSRRRIATLVHHANVRAKRSSKTVRP